MVSVPELGRLIRERHSERGDYDPNRPVPPEDLEEIIEAARWAPTAHNMQNFEVVAVDDPAVLDEIGRIETTISEQFLRENYAQLAFSEQELIDRGTGLLASMFPPAWRVPDAMSASGGELGHGSLADTMRGAPLILVVLYDPHRRAPASEGDVLGLISLGCVMQNIWLTAESLGIGMQVMSAFSAKQVEPELHRILAIPDDLTVAFACRLGHPATLPRHYLRVRRAAERFVHRGRYTASDALPSRERKWS